MIAALAFFAFCRLINAAINLGNFFKPLLPFLVLHSQNRFLLPVEVIGNIGYLLAERFQGVADNSPDNSKVPSKGLPHWLQVSPMRFRKLPLI